MISVRFIPIPGLPPLVLVGPVFFIVRAEIVAVNSQSPDDSERVTVSIVRRWRSWLCYPQALGTASRERGRVSGLGPWDTPPEEQTILVSFR